MNGDFYFYDAPNGVRLIKNRRLDAFENITHAFTTRRGGVSTGECESLNLSWKRRKMCGRITAAWRRLWEWMLRI